MSAVYLFHGRPMVNYPIDFYVPSNMRILIASRPSIDNGLSYLCAIHSQLLQPSVTIKPKPKPLQTLKILNPPSKNDCSFTLTSRKTCFFQPVWMFKVPKNPDGRGTLKSLKVSNQLILLVVIRDHLSDLSSCRTKWAEKKVTSSVCAIKRRTKVRSWWCDHTQTQISLRRFIKQCH